MAVLIRSWSFVLLTSAIVLASAIPESPVAAIGAKGGKNGYDVKTVLDGNKLGLSFYSIHEDAGEEKSVIALDSTKSSILRVSLPLSQSSAVERISGSADGKPGYRDGLANEALFDHPRKLTLDRDGNIYVADPKNAAVRMVTRTGLVKTIAGGSNRTGHDDGEGCEATFSNDFDVTYLHSTCTLAIADRGNRMVREIQLPQFIGRCSGATPNSPDSPFKSATFMCFLVGVVGIVAGVTGTILTISTRRLEQLQSRLCWATTEGPSSSIWTRTMRSSSTLQLKETSTTRSSVTRNEAVEHLVWSPALIMEVLITLFEKVLYLVLYSLSLLIRLLCSRPCHKSGTKISHNGNNETDQLSLDEQAGNQPSISRSCSLSLLPAISRVGSMGSLLIQRSLRNFQHASPQVKDFLILEDLIDFSEPAQITKEIPPVDSAPAGSIAELTQADVICNDVKVDSMMESCLAELAASSPQSS